MRSGQINRTSHLRVMHRAPKGGSGGVLAGSWMHASGNCHASKGIHWTLMLAKACSLIFAVIVPVRILTLCPKPINRHLHPDRAGEFPHTEIADAAKRFQTLPDELPDVSNISRGQNG